MNSNTNPDLFVLHYKGYEVKNLVVVPKYFFTPDIIEKRKPLSETARRAGWIGSNILFSRIPEQGKIQIIKNGEIVSPSIVFNKYQHASNLNIVNIEKRSWLFDVLNCVNSMPDDLFSLNDIYSFENFLKSRHPNNNNIRDKIRQQLQFLRDNGMVKFIDNQGHYMRIK